MGLTINTKHPCNTIGYITNKGSKPQQIILPNDRIAIKHSDLGIVILKPSIDRLKFGFEPDEKLFNKHKANITTDEYEAYVFKSLAGDGFHTGDTQLEYIEKNASFKKQPYVAYDVNLLFRPCPNSKPVLIQIRPKKPAHSFMRFDMNPNQISKKGMDAFWKLVDENLLLLPGVTSLGREDFLIWSKINQLEVAIDILGLRPSDAEVKSNTNNKPVPQKSQVYKSKTGRIQTIYAKLKKGSNTEYLYDKRQERIDCGAEPIYGDFLHSRYEFRVNKTTFYKMAKITNRCGRVSIRSLDYVKFSKMKYTQHLFIRYALNRTLEKALEVIPVKHQPSYKAAYETTMRKIWDPKKIWSYWPETLKNSNLIPPDKSG